LTLQCGCSYTAWQPPLANLPTLVLVTRTWISGAASRGRAGGEEEESGKKGDVEVGRVGVSLCLGQIHASSVCAWCTLETEHLYLFCGLITVMHMYEAGRRLLRNLYELIKRCYLFIDFVWYLLVFRCTFVSFFFH